jgi:phosphoribosylformylglycinamidine cyclo-ligase
MNPRPSYARAGVDVEAGDRAVELMKAAVASTHGPSVLGGLGGFGAAFAMPGGYRDPVLVSATDGVGTKTAIAAAMDRFDTIGIDLVAMCADDVVCTGAAPLFFLDYVAVGRLDPAQVSDLVTGIATGCRIAGCSLIGGETAEHPGLMGEDEFDLAGFCVGVVERARFLDGSATRSGDAIVGLAASGLHANGFSLVRALLAERDIRLDEPYIALVRRTLGEMPRADDGLGDEGGTALATLGEMLITPTRIYGPALLALRDALADAGSELRGVAHITGGGLPSNTPRMLAPALGARLDPRRWAMPSLQRWLGALGGVLDDELRATFNGGLGMVVAVPADAVEATIRTLAAHDVRARLVGEVVEADELGGRYAEGPLRRLDG